MKFVKKFPVAVGITALTVALCLAYSLLVAPVVPIGVKAGDWIADEANVLSESTEDTLRSYNQTFDNSYGSVIAVATVSSTRGWEMEDYAVKLAEEWELGSRDLVLLLDIGGEDVYLMEGGSWTTLDPSAILNQTVAADFFSGNYDSAVLSLFSTMSVWYPENGGTPQSTTHGLSTSPNGFSLPSIGGFSMILRAIIIILIILVLIALIGRLGGGSRRGYRRTPPPPPPPRGPRPGGYHSGPRMAPPPPRPGGGFGARPGPRMAPPPPRPGGGFGSGARPGAGPRPSAAPRTNVKSGGVPKARPSRPTGGSGGSRSGSFGGRGGGFGGRK